MINLPMGFFEGIGEMNMKTSACLLSGAAMFVTTSSVQVANSARGGAVEGRCLCGY